MLEGIMDWIGEYGYNIFNGIQVLLSLNYQFVTGVANFVSYILSLVIPLSQTLWEYLIEISYYILLIYNGIARIIDITIDIVDSIALVVVNFGYFLWSGIITTWQLLISFGVLIANKGSICVQKSLNFCHVPFKACVNTLGDCLKWIFKWLCQGVSSCDTFLKWCLNGITYCIAAIIGMIGYTLGLFTSYLMQVYEVLEQFSSDLFFILGFFMCLTIILLLVLKAVDQNPILVSYCSHLSRTVSTIVVRCKAESRIFNFSVNKVTSFMSFICNSRINLLSITLCSLLLTTPLDEHPYYIILYRIRLFITSCTASLWLYISIIWMVKRSRRCIDVTIQASSNDDHIVVSDDDDRTEIHDNDRASNDGSNVGSEYDVITDSSSEEFGDENEENLPQPSITIHLPARSGTRTALGISSLTNNSDRTTPDALQKILEIEEQKKRCVVCQDSPKCVLVLPCRHMCMCVECAHELVSHRNQQRRTCPLCRCQMETVMNVYM